LGPRGAMVATASWTVRSGLWYNGT
jgi:hypothetical protein